MANRNPNIQLKWCPTTALTEWAEHHFYYLPDAIAEGEYDLWCHTLHEIMLELNDRQLTVKLTIQPEAVS